MKLDDTIVCFMHAHCIVLAIICLVMTGLGIRSAFFPMIAVFFYTISTILKLAISKFTQRSFWFLFVHLTCQVMPFWLYTYMAFTFLTVFAPMQGRDGPKSKPEILISLFVAVFAIHFAGFILPILHKFRKGRILSLIFAGFCVVCIIIAATPAGFPYKQDVAPQRFYVLHTQRVIRNYSGLVVKNDTGYYVQPVDTRLHSLDDTTFANALPPSWIAGECKSEMFCGLPLYNSRWMDWKNYSKWISGPAPNLVIPTELKLVSKVCKTAIKCRYEFSLIAADRLVVYIEPLGGNKISDWSFNKTPLEKHYDTPYFAYHVDSMEKNPFQFWLEVERPLDSFEGANFRLGIGAHFLYHTDTYKKEFNNFLGSFPAWAYPTHWVASYESWDY